MNEANSPLPPDLFAHRSSRVVIFRLQNSYIALEADVVCQAAPPHRPFHDTSLPFKGVVEDE